MCITVDTGWGALILGDQSISSYFNFSFLAKLCQCFRQCIGDRNIFFSNLGMAVGLGTMFLSIDYSNSSGKMVETKYLKGITEECLKRHFPLTEEEKV